MRLSTLLSVLIPLLALPLVGLVAGCSEEDRSDGEAAAVATGPAIEFSRRLHDFGTVSDAKVYTASIEFTNPGTEPLVISGWRASCQCIDPDVPVPVVAPGAIGTVDVVYSPSGMAGRHYRVTMLTNASQQPAVVEFAAYVEPLVRFEPAFPQLDAPLGTGRRMIVTLLCDDPEMELISALPDSPHFSTEILDEVPPTIRDGRAAFDLILDQDAPWGMHEAGVMVTVRARVGEDETPIEHPTRLTMRASIFGELVADPERLRLGLVANGGQVRRRINLTRRGSVPFEVTECRIEASSIPGVTVTSTRTSESRYMIDLGGTLQGRAGPFVGNILIVTDVAGEEELRITFDGTLR